MANTCELLLNVVRKYKPKMLRGLSQYVPACGLAVFVRVRLRLTDDTGTPLKGRTAVSRRKHLCQAWWNEAWFHRTLAVMHFLSDEEVIVIGAPSPHKIVVNLAPDHWEVPVRVEEASLQQKWATRHEALIYGSDDDDASDDE